MDNAATTKMLPEVFDAMQPYLQNEYGNGATMYSLGRAAATAMEEGRGSVARLIGAGVPEEIYFTSGGTESDNWVLASSVLGGKKKHIVTSAIEHHAVMDACKYLQKLDIGVEVDVLPVDEYGFVNPDKLKDAIRDDTALVSIMYANNEIGTIEPIRKLSDIAHERGVLFHTDAVQAVGKIPVNVEELGVDMLSISGHKFHSPKGIGALYIKKGVKLPAFIHGGGQERNKRAGTSNISGIVGMGVAAEFALKNMDADAKRHKGFVKKLWDGINKNITDVRRNGHETDTLPGMLNITISGIEGEAMLLMLDMHGICVSSGSACTTGSLDPSHVLLAIGLPAEVAHGSLRFSMGFDTKEEDIDKILEVFPGIVQRLRDMSPTWNG
jgi:cysteine desulfurase